MTDLTAELPPKLRAQLAAELGAAIGDRKDDWFSMVKPTFLATGRRDGSATVLVNSAGWQMTYHEDGEDRARVKSFNTALAAVSAANSAAPKPAAPKHAPKTPVNLKKAGRA